MYIITGIVKKGQGRGKKLGFPTANIILDQQIPKGVYASKVIVNGQDYNAATFIGNATTFNETTYQAETYIFDFNQDIYGEEIITELLRLVRENQKFTSAEALIDQIKKDITAIKDFFKRYEVSA